MKKITLKDKETAEELAPRTTVEQVDGLSSILGAKADEATVNQYITQHAAGYTALNTKKGSQEIATELEQYAKKSEIPDTSSFLSTSGGTLNGELTIKKGSIIRFNGTSIVGNELANCGYIMMSSSSPNKLWLDATEGIFVNGNLQISGSIKASDVNPSDIGTSSNRFRDLYLSGKISDGTNEVTVAEIKNGLSGGTTGDYLPLTGGTLTGDLTAPNVIITGNISDGTNEVTVSNIATKQWVQSTINGIVEKEF